MDVVRAVWRPELLKKGGLDAYLLSTDDRKLQPGAIRLKNKIRRKLSGN